MPTALTATYQAGTTTDPARVALAVSGAPTLTPPYQSNFAAGVDGWTVGSGSPTLTAPSAGSPATLRILTVSGSTGITNRTVTGLTIGQTYQVSAYVKLVAGIRVYLGVSTIGASTPLATTGVRTLITYSFVATATSHNVYLEVRPPVVFPSQSGDAYVDTVIVARTSGWLGTTIRRTDANGTNVLVRKSPTQDATGATGSGVMTLTDYEAALVGTVSYSVTDGNGVTAAATPLAAPTTPGLWVALPTTSTPAVPTPPAFVQPTMVTGYDEASESNGSVHKIIGRSDPIANPGPMATRSGQLVVWCADFAAAAALRDLFDAGLTAQLRQPSFPGMDLYFVATRVRVAPEDVTLSQKWTASIDYQEVARP
jgi:hypothetical protein